MATSFIPESKKFKGFALALAVIFLADVVDSWAVIDLSKSMQLITELAWGYLGGQSLVDIMKEYRKKSKK